MVVVAVRVVKISRDGNEPIDYIDPFKNLKISDLQYKFVIDRQASDKRRKEDFKNKKKKKEGPELLKIFVSRPLLLF